MKHRIWLAAPLAATLALAFMCVIQSAGVAKADIDITENAPFSTDDFNNDPGIGNTLVLQGGALSYTGNANQTIGVPDSSTVGFNWGTGGTINVCDENASLTINQGTPVPTSSSISANTIYYDPSNIDWANKRIHPDQTLIDYYETSNVNFEKTGNGDLVLSGGDYIFNTGSISDAGDLTVSAGDLVFTGDVKIVPGYSGTVSANTISLQKTLGPDMEKMGNITDSFTFTLSANFINIQIPNDITINIPGYGTFTYAAKGEWMSLDTSYTLDDEIKTQVENLFASDNLGISIEQVSGAYKVTGTLRNQCGSPGAGVENIVNMTTGYIGTAGSQFFMGNTGSDLKSVSDYRGQSKDCNCYHKGLLEGWTAWASYAYTSVEARGYGEGAGHYDGFDIYRPGMLLGLRRSFNDKTSGGFIFAYTTPELHQEGTINTADNINYNSGIESSDYQLAMHLEHVFDEKWETSLFLGMGSQYMNWRRQIYGIDDLYQFQNNTYTGGVKANTFTATFYVARPIEWSDSVVLRPTIGLDSEHSYVYGFDESGTDLTGSDINFMTISQRFKYGRSDHSVNTGRLGLTASWLGPQKRGAMSFRLFYGVQLGGDDAAYLSVKGMSEAASYSKRYKGLVVGQESLNLGYGMFYYLNQAKTLSASCDYNAIFYKNATTQNVSAGVQYKF